ncbi:MAG: hypothetical protein CMI54_06430 [Parcubacteria group bacterium]|nr:hypothetical protein [Parcubacteria group bacterium]
MPKASTQQFLEISQIKEGVIVLKNHALRGVLMVSSLNFALKSEEEQNAIIYQFQSFLNSLDFSLQIVVQSRKLNITGYLDKIKELEKKQKNELLKVQTTDYRNFIKELIKGGSIMAKSFFIVVPFTLFETKTKKATGLKELLKPSQIAGTLTKSQFQRTKSQLWQRMEFVALGLRRTGLRSVPLNTSELIELFLGLSPPSRS